METKVNLLTQEQKARVTQWVEALESGKYKQGIQLLRSDKSFCCLGVACDLFKDEIGGRWVPASDYISTYPEGYCDMFVYKTPRGERCTATELPAELVDLLGLGGCLDDDGDNAVNTKSGPRAFLTLNDEAGWSFRRIAKAIRKTYLEELEQA